MTLIIVTGLQINVLSQRPAAEELIPGTHYVPATVIVKLKPEAQALSGMRSSQNNPLSIIQTLTGVEQCRPAISEALLNRGGRSAGTANRLESIYKLNLEAGTSLFDFIEHLQSFDFVEYAEPEYMMELLAYPNDPLANPETGSQSYLAQVKAYDAWQVVKGDTNVVIAIIDTGTQYEHEDLYGNVHKNHDDPINGEDSDNDGYTDNYYGWNPVARNGEVSDMHGHGTMVAGLAAAVTNNETGMAGMGYESRYTVVKAYDDNLKRIIREWDGVIYAAQQGVKVMNLSWGIANLFSNYARDVVNYVVNEMDVVVVAAAGNTSGHFDFYPASFTNVLSVAACDASDQIATWASYSPFVGLMAPGNNVLTTRRGGGYSNGTGSSFASPIVAGTAALVRARFPHLNARQVMEQIRVTADDVYDVGRNAGLNGMLGKGRLNMHRAVTEDNWPSIRSLAVHSSGANESLIFPGDTLRIKIDWFNYLNNAQNVHVEVNSTSPMVSAVSNHFHMASAPAGDTLKMNDDSFVFVLDPSLNFGATLQFRIDLESGDYKDFEYFTIRISNDFFIAKSDNIELTISNDGDMGYKNSSFFNGNGLVYNNSRIAHRIGIAIGNSDVQLADNMVQSFNNFIRNKDFEAISLPQVQQRAEVKNDITVKYQVKENQITGLPLVIEQKTLGWQHSADYGYMALEYRMINTGKVNLEDVAAGLYIDFDLRDNQKNRAYPDDENRYMIVSAESGDLFAGLGILSHEQPILQGIDQESMNGNQRDFDLSFTKKNKYELAAGILQKTEAGKQGAGNNVSVLAGVKNNIRAGWDEKVTFVILAANTEEDLKKAFEEALQKYQIEENRIENFGEILVCENETATIEDGGLAFELYADANLTQLVDSTYKHITQPVEQDTSLYMVSLASGYRSKARLLEVRIDKPEATFQLPNNGMVELLPGTSVKVDFENTSQGGHTFFWNFDNGFTSTVKNTSTRYSEEGTYNIQLRVSSVRGCVNEVSNELNVLFRSPQLQMANNTTVCYREPVTLTASNSQQIKVYSDFRLSELLYEGSQFTSMPVEKETIFYVTNASHTLESQAQTVRVKISKPQIEILALPDTSKSPNPVHALIFDNSPEHGDYKWLREGSSELLEVGQKSISMPAAEVFAQPIQLVKTNADGCSDSASFLLQAPVAAQPESLQFSSCRNAGVEINLHDKGVFAFYRDQAMQQLLHVGSSFNLNAGETDMEVYYSCLNTFSQSAPAPIYIQVSGPELAIYEAASSASNARGETFHFIAETQNTSWIQWTLPSGETSDKNEITVIFDHPGEYEIFLMGQNDMGCTDSVSYLLTVAAVTALNELNDASIQVYPNPTAGDVHISAADIDRIEIADLGGRVLQTIHASGHMQSGPLNLSAYPDGIYMIRLYQNEGYTTKRIIKRVF